MSGIGFYSMSSNIHSTKWTFTTRTQRKCATDKNTSMSFKCPVPVLFCYYLKAYLPYVLHEQYISSLICLPNTVLRREGSFLRPFFFLIFVEHILLHIILKLTYVPPTTTSNLISFINIRYMQHILLKLIKFVVVDIGTMSTSPTFWTQT